MPAQKAKKRLPPLEKRQQDFVFKAPTNFAPVKREQIHGVDHLLEQLEPHIALIKRFNPANEDSRFCRGMIFYGPSGTGKTYLARYVATETDARFVDAREFPREESDEQQWTRYDIKFLFALLKKYVANNKKPIILFWDQFEEFVESTEEDDREVLSQLYIELDGLEGSANGIVFIGATTKDPEDFEDQLTRPGRLSFHFRFEPPTKKGRAKILRYYLDQKPHEDVDVESMVALLEDSTTQATIKQLVEVAYDRADLRAGTSGSPTMIEKDDLLKAILLELFGQPAAREAEKTQDTRKKISVHEMGHALIAWILGWPVIAVNSISSGDFGGRTWIDFTPEDLVLLQSYPDQIACDLAGFIAGKIVGNPIETGYSTDFANAKQTADKLVRELAAGTKMRERYGPITFGEDGKQSEELLRTIEGDVADLLKEGESRATEILEAVGKEKLIQLAEVLCEKKVLLRAEVEELFQKHGIKKR